MHTKMDTILMFKILRTYMYYVMYSFLILINFMNYVAADNCLYQKTVQYERKNIIESKTLFYCNKNKKKVAKELELTPSIKRNYKSNKAVSHSEYMNQVYYGNKKNVNEILYSLGVDENDNGTTKNVLSFLIKLLL